MILCSLELQNFKKYTQKRFMFDDGLVGIIGKNGSGKSTIFEAILFALYGELKTKGSKELIRNSSVNQKELVSICLEFELDSLSYKVVREFRGKALSANAKFYKNEELMVAGAKEVTNYIIKLVKMGKDAFMHTLFASQKELASLSNLKPEDRKKMIRKLLGLEKIDAIELMLIEKSRELKREIDAFRELLLSNDDIALKQNQVKIHNKSRSLIGLNLNSNLKELDVLKLKETNSKNELEILQKTKEYRTKLFSELGLIKNTLESNNIQQTKLSIQLSNLQQNQKDLALLEPIKIEYECLELGLKEQQNFKEIQIKKDGLNKEQTQLREQYIKAKNDIDTLESEVKDYENLQSSFQTTKAELDKLQANIKVLESQIQAINSSIFGEQKLIDTTKAQIAKIQAIGKGSSCPTCTRPLLEEYDKVIATLSNTIHHIQTEKIAKQSLNLLNLQSIKADQDKQKIMLDKEFQDLNRCLGIIEAKQKDLAKQREYFNQINAKGLDNKKELEELLKYNYDEKLHLEMIAKFQTLKPKFDEYKRLQTLIQRVLIVQNELDETSKAIEQNLVAFKSKENEIKAVAYDEIYHKAKVDEFALLQKQKDNLMAVINELNVKMASIDGEIKILQASLDTNKKHLEKLAIKQLDSMDYDKIKVSLSEFKTKLNSKVAPRISQIASMMYSQITKGKYQHIEVDNDFDFYIYDEGQRFPIDRFSGGEVDLANLVLRIAISKTLSELNGSRNLGFLAFDEVFGSQDESRRMQILEAFHTIKEQYRQIFLISHEMEIKEMFERVIEI